MIKKRQLQILTANFNAKTDKKGPLGNDPSRRGDPTLQESNQSPLRKQDGSSKSKKAKRPAINPLAILAQSGLSPAEQLAFLQSQGLAPSGASTESLL